MTQMEVPQKDREEERVALQTELTYRGRRNTWVLVLCLLASFLPGSVLLFWGGASSAHLWGMVLLFGGGLLGLGAAHVLGVRSVAEFIVKGGVRQRRVRVEASVFGLTQVSVDGLSVPWVRVHGGMVSVRLDPEGETGLLVDAGHWPPSLLATENRALGLEPRQRADRPRSHGSAHQTEARP